jgi:hypothetical protein
MNHRLGYWISAALAACGTTATRAEHTIKLTRPMEVGQKLHVQAKGSAEVSTTVTMGGEPQDLGAVSFSVRFDSVAEIIKVDRFGRPMAVAHTINECVMIRRDRPSLIVPPGATLIARRGTGETTFFVKKRRFSDVQKLALEVAAGLDDYGMTDDELFGSSQPREVGGQWPINAEALAAEFQKYGTHRVNPDLISGTTSLVGIINQDGRPCQIIRTVVIAEDALPGRNELPPGTRLTDANLHLETHDLLPVDETLPGLGEAMKVEMDIAFSGMLGAQRADGRITATISAQRDYKPLSASRATVSADH